ncbi:MAG TPA: DapH/DapD/GlmU-related protein [Cytophagales bacterium]|nr:DapH/DapD/GlmU-related protein [Cytophagales bacterium]
MSSIDIDSFIKGFSNSFPDYIEIPPWVIVGKIERMVQALIPRLPSLYKIENGVAIHPSAIIETNVTLKGPAIVGENCFVGANAYLRGGVFLGRGTKIGTSCEVKTTIIMNNSGIAHFNFIGDSIIGSHVNFEAGSITANHFNERVDKKIKVFFNSTEVDTNVEKFGALVGDNSKIGSNAVLSPGTILHPNSIVGRLELVDQSRH